VARGQQERWPEVLRILTQVMSMGSKYKEMKIANRNIG
jgi:hypothetical protein